MRKLLLVAETDLQEPDQKSGLGQETQKFRGDGIPARTTSAGVVAQSIRDRDPMREIC